MSSGALDQVRPGRESDLASLVRIDAQTSDNPWTEARLRVACSGDGSERVLVVEGADGVAGFIVYAVVADEASIHNIAVAPAFQGGGLGRRLMVAVLVELAREGIKQCFLEVRESNRAARRLYLALGFAEDGRRKNYYRVRNGREDALLMSLAL